MRRIWIVLLLVTGMAASCAPPSSLPPLATETSLSTLPPTWTAALSKTPTADIPTALPTTAAPTSTTNHLSAVPFKKFQMMSPQEGWAWRYTKDSKMRIWRTSDGGFTWAILTPDISH